MQPGFVVVFERNKPRAPRYVTIEKVYQAMHMHFGSCRGKVGLDSVVQQVADGNQGKRGRRVGGRGRRMVRVGQLAAWAGSRWVSDGRR